MIDTTSLINLCSFGAEVGTRLVKLAAWVDGVPTTVKSLGFEIWAACEVLCELSMITARAQLSQSTPFFNPSALEEIASLIETFDEVIHEAGRGVLVSYERLAALNVLEKRKKDSAVAKDKIYLSFQERTRWPLFQHRIKIMMEALVNAKLDLTLQILVYWVVWEAESRRRSKSSIFGHLKSADRASLISQLWNNKARREQEIARSMPQQSSASSNASTTGSSSMSILALSQQSGTSSPVLDVTGPGSCNSTDSPNSLLRRMGSRFARASNRRLESIGLKARKQSYDKSSDDEESSSELPKHSLPSRQTSSSTERSRISDSSSNSDQHQSLRRVRSNRPDLGSKRQSMITWDSSQIIYKPGLPKAPSWSAGPTKSAKEGIAREWESLQLLEDDLTWNNEERELSSTKDPRELGRKLLFTQLEAQMPFWVVYDAEGVQETGEMLVGRWIESGRVRRRMAEWQDLVPKQKPGEVQGRENLRFHFAQAI